MIRLPQRLHHPQRRGRASALVGLLVTAIALQGALPGLATAQGARPEAGRVGVPLPGPKSKPDPGLLPSIQYAEAMAHADDERPFTPGDKVTTPFRPRAGGHLGRRRRRTAGAARRARVGPPDAHQPDGQRLD